MYAFSENFVLPLSHDEVVHGKRSLLDKMPGDRWQKFANLRALYAYMWAHPGKKLLFMGGELGAVGGVERTSGSLDWHLLENAEHEGDAGARPRPQPRLPRRRRRSGSCDFDPAGFRWLEANDAANNVLAFARVGEGDAPPLVCVLNFSPVPRHDYRVGDARVRPLARGAEHRLGLLRRQRRRQPRRRRGRGGAVARAAVLGDADAAAARPPSGSAPD